MNHEKDTAFALAAQMAVQRSSSFFVRQNVLVNPFMTEGKTFAFENSRDLLRTEVLVQTLFNIRPYLKANALLPFNGPSYLADVYRKEAFHETSLINGKGMFRITAKFYSLTWKN